MDAHRRARNSPPDRGRGCALKRYSVGLGHRQGHGLPVLVAQLPVIGLVELQIRQDAVSNQGWSRVRGDARPAHYQQRQRRVGRILQRAEGLVHIEQDKVLQALFRRVMAPVPP